MSAVMRLSCAVVVLASTFTAGAIADGYDRRGRVAGSPIWSGPYVGVHYGLGEGNSDWTLSNGTTSPNLDLGTVFGGHAGYQAQWGALITGIDISYSGVDLDGRAPCGTTVCETTIDNLLLTNGRLGYAIGNWMLYATGGWARSTIDITVSDDRHVSGWNIGGGYEYMISTNVIVGLNYIHVDYNDETFGLAGGGAFGESVKVDADLDVVRARLTVQLVRERGW